MDRFNGVIPPTEVLVHVSFEEAETMLTENGGWQVLSYCATAKGELDFHYWKQRQGFAGGRILSKLVGGKDIGITVQLGWEWKVVILDFVVLVSFEVSNDGRIGEAGKQRVDGC